MLIAVVVFVVLAAFITCVRSSPHTQTQYFRGQFEQPTFAVQTPMQNAVEREISRYLFQQVCVRCMGCVQSGLCIGAHGCFHHHIIHCTAPTSASHMSPPPHPPMHTLTPHISFTPHTLPHPTHSHPTHSHPPHRQTAHWVHGRWRSSSLHTPHTTGLILWAK